MFPLWLHLFVEQSSEVGRWPEVLTSAASRPQRRDEASSAGLSGEVGPSSQSGRVYPVSDIMGCSDRRINVSHLRFTLSDVEF